VGDACPRRRRARASLAGRSHEKTRGPLGAMPTKATPSAFSSEAGKDNRLPPPPARALRARRSKSLFGRRYDGHKSTRQSDRVRAANAQEWKRMMVSTD
jgi:hypothetical protein